MGMVVGREVGMEVGVGRDIWLRSIGLLGKVGGWGSEGCGGVRVLSLALSLALSPAQAQVQGLAQGVVQGVAWGVCRQWW